MIRSVITGLFAVALTALAGAPALISHGPQESPADLVLLNGKIVTLETPAEVQALAARGGRIVALGSNPDIKRLAGQNTEVIDATSPASARRSCSSI